MAENSKIEWTTHTFNPWRGCQKVSPGCANCYAEKMSKRNPSVLGVWGADGKRVAAAESAWREPLKWDRKAKEAGERHRVFCASLADVFEDWNGQVVDSEGDPQFLDGYGGWLSYGEKNKAEAAGKEPCTLRDVRRRLSNLITATPNLDWLLLTKRPENALPMACDAWCKKVAGHVSQNEGDGRHWDWPANVWLGTSVEDQQRADERIPHLLQVPAAVRFLSCEPLLGPLEFSNVSKRSDAVFHFGKKALDGISWVIVGGESGPNARPMHPVWARSIRDQCQAAGVAFHFKQWGEWIHSHPKELALSNGPVADFHGLKIQRVGKKAAGRLLDGREWNEFPAAAKV